MRRLVAALPDDLTPWQVAFWFAAGNEWLDGAAPQDSLDDPAVLTAATWLGDPAIG